MSDTPLQPWTVLEEMELLNLGARLMVSRQRVRLPDGREVDDYLRFATQTFVCIFAVTDAGLVICERHYKHGPGRVILSLPAGAREDREDPMAAAQRELLEETGYRSDDWHCLGEALTHANAGGGRFHMFLARGCRKVAEPESGDLEEMRIEAFSPTRLLQAAVAGEMPLASDGGTILRAWQVLGWPMAQTP